MPGVSFEFAGWGEEVSAAASRDEVMNDGLALVVLNTSYNTQDEAQRQMPVDTGWAQARWGVPQFGGVWEVRDNGLTIEQGSSIEPYEYIERLNEGSSKQAPAGFLDAIAARSEDRLETDIERLITRVDNG